MRYSVHALLGSCCLIALSACSSQTSTQQAAPSGFDEQLAVALSDKDYRLYVTSGRRLTMPGVEPKLIEQAKALCGVRYLAGTSDALQSIQQGQERAHKLEFMARYNRAMMTHCFDNN